MKKTIAVLSGDGVGPEIIDQSIRVLKKIATLYHHQFSFQKGLIGAIAIHKLGNPLPDETISLCQKSDAILFGAIGDPVFDNDPAANVRPEQGLLKLRKTLGLFANLRPIFTYPSLFQKSPLKKEYIEGVNFIVVRELTGGIYFGKKGRTNGGKRAFDINEYTRDEILRVSKVAFELAKKRHKKITLVDKANVLATSQLWREVVGEFAKQYPEITLESMFVDNAAMQLLKRPSSFDVILTDNMFGDILTDEASVITGSIGMLPSASIGDGIALYEPIHGSYPKAAGANTANPVGSILSCAMMLEMSFGLTKESRAIYHAVKKTIAKDYGTKDIVSENPLTTTAFADQILRELKKTP